MKSTIVEFLYLGIFYHLALATTSVGRPLVESGPFILILLGLYFPHRRVANELGQNLLELTRLTKKFTSFIWAFVYVLIIVAPFGMLIGYIPMYLFGLALLVGVTILTRELQDREL